MFRSIPTALVWRCLTALALSPVAAMATPPQISIESPADGFVSSADVAIHFSASAFDFEDGDISSQIQWSSEGLGLIGSGAAVDLVIPPGSHLVYASVVDQSGTLRFDTVSLIVVGNRAPDVIIDQPFDGAEFEVGTLVEFSAMASDYEDGDVTASIIWTSSRDGVIGMGGLVSATLTPGEHVIRAAVLDFSGIEGSDLITVFVAGDTPPDVVIHTPHDGSEVEAGTLIDFRAEALDYEQGDLSSLLVWTSSIDGQIGVGSAFSAVLSPGEHVIRAFVDDLGGATGSDIITLFVAGNVPPDVAISTPLDGSEFEIGSSITFSGEAFDYEDGDLTAQIEWTSSLVGHLGTGASIVTELTPGEHLITASATDFAGAVGQASVLVIIEADAAPDVVIESPLDGTAIEIGDAIEFHAVAFDYEEGDVSDQIQWISSLDGPMGQGASIASYLSPGEHVVLAQVTDRGGRTGSDLVVVIVVEDRAPDVVILSPTDGAEYVWGDLLMFSATAFDFEDGDVSSLITWTSSIDGLIGVGERIFASLTPGEHTIRASVRDSDFLIGADSILVFSVNACPADLNRNNQIDLSDLAILLTNFGTNDDPAWNDGDLDLDGDVDLIDLAGVLSEFGGVCQDNDSP